MENATKKSYSTRGSKIAITLAVLSFAIYLLNVITGKVNIVYEKDLLQVGPISEFFILLFSSTTFIVAALLQEEAWKSNHESKTD